MGVTFWLFLSFCVFLALVFKPAKNALLKALDAKVALARRATEEARDVRAAAEAEFAAADLELQQFAVKREQMLELAAQQVRSLYQSYREQASTLATKREEMLSQSIEHNRLQYAIRFKKMVLRASIEAARAELKAKGAKADNQALLANRASLLRELAR